MHRNPCSTKYRHTKYRSDTTEHTGAKKESFEVHTAELVAATTIGLCMTIDFNPNKNSYSISYYGAHLATFWVLAVGFFITSYFLLRASGGFEKTYYLQPLALTLKVVGVGLVLLLLTPYTFGTFFDWTHSIIGTVVFSFQTISTVIYWSWLGHNWRLGADLVILLIGGLLAALSMPNNMLHLMLEGEIIFQIGFALAINHVVSWLSPSKTINPEQTN